MTSFNYAPHARGFLLIPVISSGDPFGVIASQSGRAPGKVVHKEIAVKVDFELRQRRLLIGANSIAIFTGLAKGGHPFKPG